MTDILAEVAIGDRRLAIVQGDITRIAADAIVNAANSALAGGGGVDGAIHRAGGPSIMSELREKHPGGCPTGSAVATTAGNLPARWVIHAVGPIWRGGGHRERELLASAYRVSLEEASRLGARSVTFPAISCGVYGYPLDEGARVAVEAVRAFLAGESRIERVTFVLFSSETYGAFEFALRDVPGASGSAAQ